jgi:hypothetical protein
LINSRIPTPIEWGSVTSEALGAGDRPGQVVVDMRTYRWIWRAISGLWIALGAAAGLVVLPLVVWIALGLVAMVFCLPSAGRDSTDGGKTSQARTAGLVIAGYLGAIATLATAVFIDVGALIALLLIIGSSPAAIRWYLRKLGWDRPRPVASPATVSTSELCRQWLESYGELSRAPSHAARLRVVMARQRCLDELERRDPEGLRAWLASAASAGGDPRRFLSDAGG